MRRLRLARSWLIRASLIGEKFATDRILTRTVEAYLDGLFFAFTMAKPGGPDPGLRVRQRAQTVALLDNLINGLIREGAEAAA